MAYNPPTTIEQTLAATGIIAVGFGYLTLPMTVFGAFLSLGMFANFYHGLKLLALIASCIMLPTSSVICIISAKRGILRLTEGAVGLAIRLLVIAWISVPAGAILWALVAECVLPNS